MCVVLFIEIYLTDYHILCKKKFFLFIVIYDGNFLPHIPYTVVFPEEWRSGRNVLHKHTKSPEKKLKTFVVNDGTFRFTVSYILSQSDVYNKGYVLFSI